MERGHPGNFLLTWFDSFQEVIHSFAIEDADHDTLWLALFSEFQEGLRVQTLAHVEFEIDIFVSCVGITVTTEGHWHAGCHKSSWTCAV